MVDEANKTSGNPEEGIPIADAPEDEGMFFAPERLKGSGTIRRDGTYGPPEPDPTVVRGLGPNRTSGGRLVDANEGHALYGEAAEENLTDDEREQLKADADGASDPAPSPAPAKAAPAKKSTSNS